jgi:hypothetical protein
MSKSAKVLLLNYLANIEIQIIIFYTENNINKIFIYINRYQGIIFIPKEETNYT